ncbi:hypothetical protein J5226_15490 [Lysobacter sp. K5869]|uniref:hypothetical protein n=1 Tax=Lysobacter sp. K5869 TaxID=2820808 RepID=UPI001C0648A6|nr:hypothetical protein [Lysobacter sp. K5869]QWP75044.1 hypothetical protein J5226_15490 [Lysobacter sp. K5869]
MRHNLHRGAPLRATKSAYATFVHLCVAQAIARMVRDNANPNPIRAARIAERKRHRFRNRYDMDLAQTVRAKYRRIHDTADVVF